MPMNHSAHPIRDSRLMVMRMPMSHYQILLNSNYRSICCNWLPSLAGGSFPHHFVAVSGRCSSADAGWSLGDGMKEMKRAS